MNRRLVDALCDFHYAPTPKARENLIRENIPEDRIIVTGNTAIDALLDAAAQPYKFADPLLDHAGRERRLLLVTAHRRESFGEPFMQICTAIRELAETNRDVEIIYSVHPNPNVRKAVNEVLLERERVFLVEPLDYITFVHLLKKATIVLTDSGGIQEEAPSLGKPVLVMREVTERPEGVEAGTAMLVGTARKRIVDGVQRLLDDQKFYEGMAHAVNPYGDGLASKRIGDHLEGMAKRLF
jgi:UDP-N-acetylglucosamine 2-epimerase (non-hydrolysing)